MKVKIKGKEYNYEFGSVWGPLYTYEELFGKDIPFTPNKTLAVHLMMYCILVRSNTDLDLNTEEFLESLNDLELERSMRDYYFKRLENLTSSASGETSEEDKKKIECSSVV